jgi:hypothetical protein
MAPKYARALIGSLLVLALAALAACGSKPAPPPAAPAAPAGVKVTGISVGRSLGADQTIADKTESFKPADTIYVSIKTEGAASSATLAARWTFQDGQVVTESHQTIAPTGDAFTEFHISKPDGLPAGKYKVEVMLDGASAGIKDFEVS